MTNVYVHLKCVICLSVRDRRLLQMDVDDLLYKGWYTCDMYSRCQAVSLFFYMIVMKGHIWVF